MITKKLEENGFKVTYNLSGIPTAFKATYGEGKPSLGILAEYDALEGMSQVACETEKNLFPEKIRGMAADIICLQEALWRLLLR